MTQFDTDFTFPISQIPSRFTAPSAKLIAKGTAKKRKRRDIFSSFFMTKGLIKCLQMTLQAFYLLLAICKVSNVILFLDDPFIPQSICRRFHGNHSFLSSHFDIIIYLDQISSFYEILDSARHVHELMDCDPSDSLSLRYEPLGKYAEKTIRKPHTDLILNIRTEELHDTADGLDTSGSVQCGEDEVSRLCKIDSRFHRFLVTHLSDHDDIRIFTHRRPYRRNEGLGIPSDLSLGEY